MRWSQILFVCGLSTDLPFAFVSAGTQALKKFLVLRVFVVRFPFSSIKKDDIAVNVRCYFFGLFGRSSTLTRGMSWEINYTRLLKPKQILKHNMISNKPLLLHRPRSFFSRHQICAWCCIGPKEPTAQWFKSCTSFWFLWDYGFFQDNVPWGMVLRVYTCKIFSS